MKRILLLGGVTEALAIARTLGPEHIYSLAGVGRVPTDAAEKTAGVCVDSILHPAKERFFSTLLWKP